MWAKKHLWIVRAKDRQKERDAVNRGVVAGGKKWGKMVGEKDGVNAKEREKAKMRKCT